MFRGGGVINNVKKCLEEMVCSPSRQMFIGGDVVHTCRQKFREGVVHTI